MSQLAESEVGADERPVDKQTLPTPALQQQLADESEVLGWCIGWLEPLALGETVLVNLRVESTLDINAAGVKHRRSLADPEPELTSLSQREQRAILKEKMGLPPS